MQPLRLSHPRALGLMLLVTSCSVYDVSSLGPGDDAGLDGRVGQAGARGGYGGGSATGTTSATGGNASGGASTSAGTGGSGDAGSSGTSGGATGGSTSGSGGATSNGGASSGGAAGRGGAAGGGSRAGGAGGASSGGASNGGASSGGASGRGGAVGTPSLDLIDDLEDGNGAIRIVAPRNGVWDTSNDMSAGGMQTPAPTMFAPSVLGGDTPYPGDKFAAYTKGSGFTVYGAFMNVSMRSWSDYPTTPTYDASAYVGLSFWAKVGASSTTNVRVRFISADTDPRGGQCKTTGTADQLCFNHFYLDVPVTTSWKLYQIHFADFVQTNTGRIFPAIDLAQMYGLEFYFLSSTSFEVWIDDLSFIKP